MFRGRSTVLDTNFIIRTFAFVHFFDAERKFTLYAKSEIAIGILLIERYTFFEYLKMIVSASGRYSLKLIGRLRLRLFVS